MQSKKNRPLGFHHRIVMKNKKVAPFIKGWQASTFILHKGLSHRELKKKIIRLAQRVLTKRERI